MPANLDKSLRPFNNLLVLDDIFTVCDKSDDLQPDENDNLNIGDHRVLKNGLRVVSMLAELIEKYDFTIYINMPNNKEPLLALKQTFILMNKHVFIHTESGCVIISSGFTHDDTLESLYKKLECEDNTFLACTEGSGLEGTSFNLNTSTACDNEKTSLTESEHGTIEETLQHVSIKANEVEQLRKIKNLCRQYLAHVAKVNATDKVKSLDLRSKEQVFLKLAQAKDIQEAKVILTDHQDMLTINRTPMALYVLKAICVILTFPLSLPAIAIYSAATRGTANFFKPDSQVTADKIEEILLLKS